MGTTVADLNPKIKIMSRSELETVINELEFEYGSFEELRKKAAYEMLTASERVGFRKLRQLYFLIGK